MLNKISSALCCQFSEDLWVNNSVSKQSLNVMMALYQIPFRQLSSVNVPLLNRMELSLLEYDCSLLERIVTVFITISLEI